MQVKRKLYLIGGLSQVGKSAIKKKMKAEQESLRVHSTDDMRRRPTSFERSDLSIDDCAWLDALKLIEVYDREDLSDILFEGIAITPGRTHELNLKNLVIRAAFIGYSDKCYAEVRLAHAKGTWLYAEMQQTGRGSAYVRDAMPAEILKNEILKKQAEDLGRGYFDAIKIPVFEDRNQIVIDYLHRE